MARNLKNLDRLKAKLAAMPGQIKPAIKQALDKNADQLMSLQKNLVPVGETGVLASTIRKEQGALELSVVVKAGGEKTTKKIREDAKGGAPDYDYANAVEFGTEHAAAHPFFFPAFRALKKTMKSRLSRAISAAIKGLSNNSDAEAA